MREKTKKNFGFTIIEIMVALSIIGLVGSLAAANYLTSLKQGRDARRRADLEQIRAALEMYKADKGYYPPQNQTGWCTVLYGCGNLVWYNDVAGALISEGYLSTLPQDPLYANQLGRDYFFRHVSNNQYELYAQLERDDTGAFDQGACACTGIYDYKVTNP